MTVTVTTLRLTRVASGSYEVRHAGHVWAIQRFDSEYGDVQWVIDRDDQTTWAQVDTLGDARRLIAAQH